MASRWTSSTPACPRTPPTFTDAGITISLDLNGDGNPEYLFTWDPVSQTGSKAYDANSDGVPNYSATLSNNPEEMVALIDTTGAGVPDTQITDIYNPDAGTHEQLVSTDILDGGLFPDGGEPDGGWYLERQDTFPLVINDTDSNGFYDCPPPKPGSGISGSAFDPPSAFPAGFPNVGAGGSGIGIFSNGGPNNGSDGSCSASNTTAMTNALNCAINEAHGCISQMNSAIAAELASFLQNSSWDMACGNQVPSSGAQSDTDAPPCAFGTSSYNGGAGSAPECAPRRTNFNPTQVANATPNALCQVMLHEMMHAAGVDSPDGDTHDVCRDDPVYACSRYCTACSTTTMPSGETPAQDCARCADSDSNKSKCGSAVIPADVSYFLPVCHGGIGDNADCLQNIGWSTVWCDETNQLMDTGFLCCAECPANDTNNDFPCSPADLDMGMNGCLGSPASGCPMMGGM